MWARSRKLAIGLAIVAAVALVAGVAWYFIAPKPAELRSEAAPTGQVVAEGVFRDGDPLHHASGSVRLVEVDGRTVLRFEDYDATNGPDVYVYLTPMAHATSASQVEGDGLKVRTPTPMGQATLRGDFNLEVPAGVDVRAFGGVAIWCVTYNVLFGYAELSPS